MNEAQVTLTAWLRTNRELVLEYANQIKDKCLSKDNLLEQLILEFKIQMERDNVMSTTLVKMTSKTLLSACRMVELHLPRVRPRGSVYVLENTLGATLESDADFLQKIPGRAKQAAFTKASKEALRLIGIMKGILQQIPDKIFMVKLTPDDVIRALDAALNGGSPKSVVAGLNILTSIKVKHQIGLALIASLRSIIVAMPNLESSIGRNNIAAAFYCAMTGVKPSEKLFQSLAIVLLRAEEMDFAERVIQRSLF